VVVMYALLAPEHGRATVRGGGAREFWRVLRGFHGYAGRSERDCSDVRREPVERALV
jgi:hypothetical protein